MRKGYSFLLIIMLFLFSSCAGQTVPNTDIKVSPKNRNINDLITVTYPDEDMYILCDYGGNIRELNDDYPIECVRKKDELYYVKYRGEVGYMVLTFEASGKNHYRKGGYFYSTTVSKEMLDNLKVGQTTSDVREIDSSNFYYGPTIDGTAYTSEHVTTDGYMFVITYKESDLPSDRYGPNCVITDISVELF